MLYGAIIGDIAGSKYEFNNIKYKPDTILDNDCFFTDDTVMTIAIANALITGNTYGDEMRAWGQAYPGKGYGGNFQMWLDNPSMGAYNSFGNGSAMRVSPVAYVAENILEVKQMAKLTALPTHNHPEGIKGARAVAALIYLAKTGYSKERMIDYVETVFGYEIKSCNEIRPTYEFNETCQDTVPQAISAFIDSDNFEDCIKLAISLGGDSDTLAAIAGSIAEAYYGIPRRLTDKCEQYLPVEMLKVLDEFNKRFMEV